MRVRSSAIETINGPHLLTLAAQFKSPAAGYLVMQVKTDTELQPDFFGAGHYVEISDQSAGRYGGIQRLSVSTDLQSLDIELDFDAPNVGRHLTLDFDEPIKGDPLRWLRTLQSSIGEP